jgi:hypothetical protein
MNTSLLLILAAVIIHSSQTSGSAAVIFNSFGSDSRGYADDDEVTLGPGNIVARPFHVTTDACTLDKIVLPVVWELGSAPVILSIQADSGGLPSGLPLESFTLSRPSTPFQMHFVMTATSVSKPLLDSGTYYIVLSMSATETGFTGWPLTTSPIPGPLLLNAGSGSGWMLRNGEDVAVAVYGNAVPEPAAPVVLLGGVLILGTHRHRPRTGHKARLCC